MADIFDAIFAAHARALTVNDRLGPATYRGFEIYRNPQAMAPGAEWQFTHKDYDGAPDANDDRCGHGSSIDDCKDQIDEMSDRWPCPKWATP